MISFDKRYFLLFVILLLIEIGIAIYITDNIIRPYIGDFLVVMLLYCLLKAFFSIKNFLAAVVVLLFAILVELLQYIQIIKMLELRDYNLATTVMGTQFDWLDMLAYTAGVGTILLIENWRSSRPLIIS